MKFGLVTGAWCKRVKKQRAKSKEQMVKGKSPIILLRSAAFSPFASKSLCSVSSSYWPSFGGAALGDAADPSTIGVVLLSPLGWGCLLLSPFGWCCVPLTFFWGGGAFSPPSF